MLHGVLAGTAVTTSGCAGVVFDVSVVLLLLLLIAVNHIRTCTKGL